YANLSYQAHQNPVDKHVLQLVGVHLSNYLLHDQNDSGSMLSTLSPQLPPSLFPASNRYKGNAFAAANMTHQRHCCSASWSSRCGSFPKTVQSRTAPPHLFV